MSIHCLLFLANIFKEKNVKLRYLNKFKISREFIKYTDIVKNFKIKNISYK